MLEFNLQLFSEEKTEQPSAKKKSDSRKKGQVVQSKDLSSTFAFVAVFFSITLLSDFLISEIFGFTNKSISLFTETDSLFENGDINVFLIEIIWMILKLSLPTLLIAMAIGVLMSYLQVGFLFTIEPVQPKFSKINPLKGAKNMFSMQALVELVKSLLKASLILYVSYGYVKDRLIELLLTIDIEIGQMVVLMWEMVIGVVLRSGLILLVIAIFDYGFKKWKNNKDLMMTKQEVKDEYKQSEGDPLLKSKIKEKQRAMAMSRMMQDVPTADVIITNPTHFAIAIKYDVKLGDAPRVVAKGKDLIAQNIKRIATEAKVPIVENKPLAQTLYKTTEIGQFIPVDLYEAVAEVLAYVYTLKKNA